MKHINYKIGTLLHEGFSIKTLENFSNKQIDLLYEKVKKSNKETKEAVTKTTTSTTYSKDEVKGKTFGKNDDVNVTINQDDSVTVTKEGEVTEKAVSKQQQKAMGIALSAKRGDIPKSELKGASKEMVKMSEKNLKDFASTKHKGLPEKKETKEAVKNLEESIMKLIESHLHPTTTKEELLRVIKGHKR
jgi:hypothetical protein